MVALAGGGGLCIYARTSYSITYVDQWSLCCPEVEYQWVLLGLKDTRDTYICNVYRPPSGNPTSCLELLENKLLDIPPMGTPHVIICGDMNIDLHKGNDAKCKNLKSFLNRTRTQQLISESTRVTEYTSTLIDHIIVNRPEIYACHGVLDLGISDHSLTYVVRKKQKLRGDTKYVWSRSYHNYESANYYHDLTYADWMPVLACDDVNDALDTFY